MTILLVIVWTTVAFLVGLVAGAVAVYRSFHERGMYLDEANRPEEKA